MSFQKKIIKMILVVLISTCAIYGQEGKQQLPQDTTQIKENQTIYKLRFNNKVNSIYSVLSLRQELFFEEYSYFSIPDRNQNLTEAPISMMQLRTEMNQTMQIYRQGTIKNDLGFVGEVLGYTNAAAAVGLAIYHIHKYGLK